MQTNNRLLHDAAKVAGGAASALAGLKQEVDVLVRQQVERIAADLDLITREEFDAVRDMAARARAEQERLESKVAALEQRLAAIAGESLENEGDSGAT